MLGDDAGGELLRGHFQRKKADDAAVRRLDVAVGADLAAPGACHVVGDIGGERSLAHAWPPGHDDQVGRLQPTHFAVEILETGREPGELAFTLVGTRGHVDGRCQCGLELLKSSAIAPGFCQIV